MSSPRPSKRQRIGRACDQCRRRKSKCDGAQPICSICHSADRTCTYQNSGRRRGLQSGYVRSLETILGIVLEQCPNSESMLQGILRDHDNLLTSDFAERSALVWRKSRVAKDVDILLTGSKDELDAQGDDGPEWDSTEVDMPDISLPIELPSIPNEQKEQKELKEVDYLDMKFPDHTAEVLDFYFVHVHCWFPIVERRDMLRVMHTQAQPFQDTGHRMTLWAILAYSYGMNNTWNGGHPDPMQMQKSLQQQIINDQDKLELGHIQTLLILVLFNLGMGNVYQAWILAAQATRMLITLPGTKEHRYQHTFHGCVFLDTMISAILQRPPCLSLEEQKAHGHVNEDDVDEWDVWIPRRDQVSDRISKGLLRALSIFNQIHDLMGWLTGILHSHEQVDLQQFQAALHQRYPYRHSANPPLLLLHLTSQFVTIAMLQKNAVGEIATYLVSTLDMLDHLFEIAGTGTVPILYCFAVQCRQCLHYIPAGERESIESRISKHLHSKQPSIYQDILHPNPADIPMLPPANITPADTVISGMQIEDGFDALFEEMVASIPNTREEPIFAQNLGFYAGDLDTDFLVQLQQPADD